MFRRTGPSSRQRAKRHDKYGKTPQHKQYHEKKKKKAMTAENKETRLTAAYTSPHNQDFTVTKSLDTPPSASGQDKAAYLGAVRKAVTETQEQINQELTSRMEEDKTRGSGTGLVAKLGVDEDKEEENYGEEVQEED